MELGDIVYIGLISGLTSAVIIIIAINHVVEGFVSRFREHMKNAIDDDSDIIDCHLVFTDKEMLMYKNENNEFVAQGTTWEELNANTVKRFPDLMFNVPTSEIKKAMEFNK